MFIDRNRAVIELIRSESGLGIKNVATQLTDPRS